MKLKTTWRGLGLFLVAAMAWFAVSCAGKKAPEAAPAEARPVANIVDNVSVTPGDAGAQIAISTAQPVSPLGYFLEEPPRVIVDIPGTALGEGVAENYPVNTSLVKEVTVSTVGSADSPTTRVIIALTGETTYEVKKDDGKVLVILGGGTPAAGTAVVGLPSEEVAPEEIPAEVALEIPVEPPEMMAEVPEAAPPAPEEMPVPTDLGPAGSIIDITTRTEGELVQVILMADGAVGGFDAFTLPSPPRIVVDLAGLSSSYPATRLDVEQGDVKKVRVGKHANKVRIVVDLQSSLVPYSTVRKGDRLIINIGEGAEAMAPEPEPPVVVPLPSEPAIEEAPPVPDEIPAEVPTGSVVEEAPPTPEEIPGEPMEAPLPEEPAVEAPTEVPAEVPVMEQPEAPVGVVPAAVPEEGYEAVEVTAVDFDWTKEKSTVRIETTGRAKYEMITNERDRMISVRIVNATIPPALERSLDTSEFASPVRMVSSYQWSSEDAKEVYVTMSLNYTPNYYVVREGNAILIIFDNPEAGQVMAAPAMAEYAAGPSVGEPESITEEGSGPGGAEFFGGVGGSVRRTFSGRLVYLDYQSIQVVDALTLLAEVAGLNLVVSGKLKGTVSLKLEAVPWDQALDIILRTQKHGGVIRGNILRVAPLKDLESEERKYQNRLKKRKKEVPLQLRIIFVSYAEPGDIQSAVKRMLTKGRGRIEVDQRTNSLLVWDVPDKLDEIESLVRRLDVETPQVLIEVRIVEARSTLTQDLGVEWGIGYHSGAQYGNPTGMNFPGTIDVGVGLVSGVTGASDTALGLGQSAVGISLGSLTNAVDLDLLLRALELEEKAKVISSPRILTLDNESAEISQGVAIPYATTSAAGTATQFVDANLKITVKPHVTSDGRIIMEINAQRNSPVIVPGSTGTGINKNEAKTQILVKDGETAVIGGIFVLSQGESQSRVPFLGKLPFIGWLFRSQHKGDDRQELIIFLTPRIVSGGDQYLRFARNPMGQ